MMKVKCFLLKNKIGEKYIAKKIFEEIVSKHQFSILATYTGWGRDIMISEIIMNKM